MGLLDVLGGNLWREFAWIDDFEPVFINGKTHRAMGALVLTVTKGIDQGFAQSLNQYLKFFLTL